MDTSQINPPKRTGRFGPRLWIGLGVAVFWIASMSLIYLFEMGRSGSGLRRMGVSPEVLMVSWKPYDHWMWIEQDDRRIGATNLAIVPQVLQVANVPVPSERTIYELTSRTRVAFSMIGLKVPIDLFFEGQMNEALELMSLQAVLTLANRRVLMQSFVEDLSFFYRISVEAVDPEETTQGDESATTDRNAPDPAAIKALLPERDEYGRVQLKGPILLRDVITPVLSQGNQEFEPGQRWTTRASDPLGGRFDTTVHVKVEDRETLTVEGEPVEAWRLTERVGSSLQSTVWYDSEGRLLRRELNGGWRLERTDISKVQGFDPGFLHTIAPPEIDREAIRTNAGDTQGDESLAGMLPPMPRL